LLIARALAAVFVLWIQKRDPSRCFDVVSIVASTRIARAN